MAHDCDATPDPDGCFRCKCRYWRTQGAPGVVYQGGKSFFHDKTIKSEQTRIVAEAKAKGNDVVPYHSVFGN